MKVRNTLKILNIILVLLIGISCNNSENDKLPRLINSIPVGSISTVPHIIEDFEIHIQYLFQDDNVTIEVDGKELFDESVTTEHLISLAHTLQIELDSGDHRITVKMRDMLITESFTFNDEMVIAVIYSWMEDELQLVYYEDGERPMYD